MTTLHPSRTLLLLARNLQEITEMPLELKNSSVGKKGLSKLKFHEEKT